MMIFCCFFIFVPSFEKVEWPENFQKRKNKKRQWSHSLYTHSSVTELTVLREEEEKTLKRIQPLDPDVVVDAASFFFFLSSPSLIFFFIPRLLPVKKQTPLRAGFERVYTCRARPQKSMCIIERQPFFFFWRRASFIITLFSSNYFTPSLYLFFFVFSI